MVTSFINEILERDVKQQTIIIKPDSQYFDLLKEVSYDDLRVTVDLKYFNWLNVSAIEICFDSHILPNKRKIIASQFQSPWWLVH